MRKPWTWPLLLSETRAMPLLFRIWKTPSFSGINKVLYIQFIKTLISFTLKRQFGKFLTTKFFSKKLESKEREGVYYPRKKCYFKITLRILIPITRMTFTILIHYVTENVYSTSIYNLETLLKRSFISKYSWRVKIYPFLTIFY